MLLKTDVLIHSQSSLYLLGFGNDCSVAHFKTQTSRPPDRPAGPLLAPQFPRSPRKGAAFVYTDAAPAPSGKIG